MQFLVSLFKSMLGAHLRPHIACMPTLSLAASVNILPLPGNYRLGQHTTATKKILWQKYNNNSYVKIITNKSIACAFPISKGIYILLQSDSNSPPQTYHTISGASWYASYIVITSWIQIPCSFTYLENKLVSNLLY